RSRWPTRPPPNRPRVADNGGRSDNPPPLERRHPPRLTASTLDFRRILYVHQRYGVVRILKIGPPVVRGSSRGALDAWIVHDRLVEFHHDRVDKRQDPAVILPRIVARRGVRQARGYRTVKRHVVFLERVHGEVVSRANRAKVLLRTEPRVLGRPQVLPRDVEIGVVWITAEVNARSHEVFAIDVDPRFPGRVLCLPEDVGAIVDSVEVDRLAVVV